MIPAPVQIKCPHCNQATEVAQVQGDQCPGCGYEFKRYSPTEQEAAADYCSALDGPKHLLELPDGAGWIVAHE